MQSDVIAKILQEIQEFWSELYLHSISVANLALRMAVDLGVEEACYKDILAGALLHDVGKTKIKKEILTKPGPLTPAEWREVKNIPSMERNGWSIRVIRALTEAFEFFGGYALELVIDNGKQMVILHQKDGIVRYNDEFLKFCGLYGIQPSACKNYRPRTKGKSERPFYYVQEQLLRGLEVASLNEFADRLREFQDEYNKRPHSKLGRSPEHMFEEEKAHLLKIPSIEPALIQ